MKKQAFLEAAKQWYRDYKVADSYHQFSTFVESLKRPGQDGLLESVQSGINAITENNGYSANMLVDRLTTLCEAGEAIEDDELDVSDEDLIASAGDDEFDSDEEATESRGYFGLEEQDAANKATNEKDKENGTGGKVVRDSDKKTLSDKYSLIFSGDKSKNPESQEASALAKAAIKRANKYANSDVQEAVFAGLLQWALSKKEYFKPKEGGAPFVPWVLNLKTKPNKDGKQYVLFDLQASRLADRARGIVRKSWKEGVRPSYPHAVMFRGNYYQLKPEKVNEVKSGDPRLDNQPHTPEGREIWEEISKEEYMSKMGAEPTTGQQVSISAPVSSTSEGDMTQEERIAGKGLGDAKMRTRELLDELQTALTDMNEWAKKSGKVKPFKDDILKMVKLKLANPGISEEELVKEVPSLPLRPGSSSKGKVKLHPQLMPRVTAKLKEFISQPQYKKFNELVDLMSELEEERDEVDAAV